MISQPPLLLTDLFPELFQRHIYPRLSIIDRCHLRGVCRKLCNCDLEVVPPESWRRKGLRQSPTFHRECACLFIEFRAHILFPSLSPLRIYIGKKVASLWTIDDNWGIKITSGYESFSQSDDVRIKFSDPEGFFVEWRSYKGDVSLHDLFVNLMNHMAYIFPLQ